MDTPLGKVLGPKTATVMADQLQLRTVRDLLRHYPRRYARRGEMTRLDGLELGDRVTVLAQVKKVSTRPMRQRRGMLTEVTVGDGAGSMQLVFFNSKHARLEVGAWGLFAGTVGMWQGKPQFSHPDCHLMSGDDDGDWARALVPIYPASKDVSSWVLQKSLKLLMDDPRSLEQALDDPIPEPVRRRHGLVPLDVALRQKHRPESQDEVDEADERLKWDEALVLQATLAARRRAAALEPGIARPRRGGGLLDAVDAALPFSLTEGQREVGEELAAELAREQPMNRLLQGEVGSGKTVVALRAMAQVVDAGGQAALLAPTEVLASQHARSLAAILGPLGRAGELDGDPDGTRVVLLTGSQKAAARREARAAVADGSAGIVVGTHALLQEGVEFADLGLVVVDEQHRFGVEQRDALRAKGARPPHVLVMTATPIPRTVAMTVYGDLETSTLRQLPAGRGGVSSSVVPAGAGSGSARRSPPAGRPTWSARGSGTRRAARPRMTTAPTTRTAPRRRRRAPATGGPRWRCSTSPPGCAPVRCRRCGSRCCTAGWPPTRRRPGCGPSPPVTSTSWSPPRSSRSASTSPTPPSWS
jgi:ATP-dependent DNA helicase RecG